MMDAKPHKETREKSRYKYQTRKGEYVNEENPRKFYKYPST